MSSYPVLYDKPIDQWKVTELKEELKKRRLTTKGLKDDLIRRLDESLQQEIEISNASADKDHVTHPEPVVQHEDAPIVQGIDENTGVMINKSDDENTELNEDENTELNEDENTELNDDAVDPNRELNMRSIAHEQLAEEDTNTLNPVMVAETTVESNDQGTTLDTIVETTVETNVQETSPGTIIDTTNVQETTFDTSVQTTTVETSYEVTTVVNESSVNELHNSGQELQNNGAQNKSEDLNLQLQDVGNPSHEEGKLKSSDFETQVIEVSEVKSVSVSTDNVPVNERIEDLNIQPQNDDSNPPHEGANSNSIDLETQVFEVEKVTSDSICTDIVSINEKIELKDNMIVDDVKLEFDVKHDREEPSSRDDDLDGGNLQLMDVKEPQENDVKVEGTRNNADNSDTTKNNDSGDVEFSEKLNLDGDDLMEEDPLENKQIESKSIICEAEFKSEKMEVTVLKEGISVDAMVDDTISDVKVELKNVPAASIKRKPQDQETVGNIEATKKQRRWNSDGLKVVEPNNANVSPSVTPRGSFQSNAKRNFSRSDSMTSVETPKERFVPLSSNPPTSALRIDRFLRPFTLKAVQELLGKTGTITNFWMDHIKTHCYVSYTTVEEAIETRNAVYNLQWPANGGRLLIAEFVDPQEVQMRVEAPPTPAASVNTGPVLPTVPVHMQSQPSPRVQVQRQAPHPPPALPVSLPLPPPPAPPVSNPPAARERVLPPPPPLPEKVEPPLVTLDDLFRKTKATPRIYYLPLSDEQVKAKQDAQGKIAQE